MANLLEDHSARAATTKGSGVSRYCLDTLVCQWPTIVMLYIYLYIMSIQYIMYHHISLVAACIFPTDWLGAPRIAGSCARISKDNATWTERERYWKVANGCKLKLCPATVSCMLMADYLATGGVCRGNQASCLDRDRLELVPAVA